MTQRLATLSFILAVGLFTVVGCQSRHQEGVKSDIRAQWTNVNANTVATTNAARDVLLGEGLKEVTASSTHVDGKASAKLADGTKVNVTIKKETDTTSEASVVVGTMGSPEYGAELAKKIKNRAEGR